jgi:hypothetical protein
MTMQTEVIQRTYAVLNMDISWLESVLDLRISFQVFEGDLLSLVPAPKVVDGDIYGSIIEKFNLSPAERLILVLSLSPYLKPELSNRFLSVKNQLEMIPSEIGGFLGKAYRGFIPTIQTALYLLVGRQGNVLDWLYLFNPEEKLSAFHLISLHLAQPDEPFTSQLLNPSKEVMDCLINGKALEPHYSPDFPAQKISTSLEWDDLVLNKETLDQVEDVLDWVRFEKQLLSNKDYARKTMPGYRALFAGPPGTGKTLTASLIGKATGRETYKIDLSMIVSKYVGETEKNLSKIFSRAQGQNWILFFDEADALFGKRSETKDAHDRYANQEVAYLLQRVEQYDGLVILASNYKKNIDQAFYRRLQSIVNFSLPDYSERLLLWEKSKPEEFLYDEEVDLGNLAERYKICGGSVMNVLRHCCLKAISRSSDKIKTEDLLTGINREFAKEGKTGV